MVHSCLTSQSEFLRGILLPLAFVATSALTAGCGDNSGADVVAYGNLPKSEQPATAQTSEQQGADVDRSPNGMEIKHPVAADAAPAAEIETPQVVAAPSESGADALVTGNDPEQTAIESSDAAPVETESNQAASAVNTVSAATPAEPASEGSAADSVDGTDIPVASFPDLASEDVDNGVAGEPSRPIELLIPRKRFRRGGSDGSVRVSYDDIDLLKVLNMEPVPKDAVDYFPDWLQGLDGQRIVIRGFMYPTYQLEGLKAFTLARDNGICCFVRKPKIYDIIRIEMREGLTADFVQNRPIDLSGIFRINPISDEHEMYRLYSIDDAVVLTR